MKRFVLELIGPGTDGWAVLDMDRPIGRRAVFFGAHHAAESKAVELEAAGLPMPPAEPPLDASMPERIWLQIDTEGDPNDRAEPFRGHISDLTWCAESIGGLEVEYVRKDLLDAAVAKAKNDPA